jgi:hypothetical protein
VLRAGDCSNSYPFDVFRRQNGSNTASRFFVGLQKQQFEASQPGSIMVLRSGTFRCLAILKYRLNCTCLPHTQINLIYLFNFIELMDISYLFIIFGSRISDNAGRFDIMKNITLHLSPGISNVMLRAFGNFRSLVQYSFDLKRTP